MIRLKKYLFCFIAFALINFIFNSCKKYPENIKWFPGKADNWTGGYITSYKVDGDDQIPFLNGIYSNASTNYNFTGMSRDITKEIFNKDKHNVLSSALGTGVLDFINKDKEVNLSFTPTDFQLGAYNLFITNATWKILKFKGKQLKIQAIINNKTYEIQFN